MIAAGLGSTNLHNVQPMKVIPSSVAFFIGQIINDLKMLKLGLDTHENKTYNED